MAIINFEEESYYYQTMSGEDAFTVIIRGVAFLDFELERLLTEILPEPRHLKTLRLDYAGKGALALALGLDIELQAPLKAVGTVRNKLAHDPKRHFTAEDAKDLRAALSPREKEMIPGLLARVQSKLRGPFHRLAPMDQYVLILVMLRGIIVAKRRSIENGKATEEPSAASPDPDTT